METKSIELVLQNKICDTNARTWACHIIVKVSGNTVALQTISIIVSYLQRSRIQLYNFRTLYCLFQRK